MFADFLNNSEKMNAQSVYFENPDKLLKAVHSGANLYAYQGSKREKRSKK